MSEQEKDMGYKSTASDKESEKLLTKEEQEKELEELFDVRNTAQFRVASLEVKEAWLKHIVGNKERYTKYHETWEDWLKDRGQEILSGKFDMQKTANFRQALADHKIKQAEEWLEYIEDNKDLFPQYNESWFQDRYSELKQVQE
ncbi:hypothetical protein A3B87_02340 [Candidatus Kuenenbacteria bacterium RIFCSPHIGHO2_02_FULL_39_13]|uniref:Uncharacterized protein n=1 Tax=Candidatus Kuenenbacteria bacterium RIFCSPHIGHO2_02_FULL_39_13 TaxID=1798561 RepID=A0A1F6FP58_9BACT|nr:MAG: hypothetical protein A3B87_02340 [Candidatus Kuenenbacteria bacterium RIFCSPHIGHO2_02_FULL_39_13]